MILDTIQTLGGQRFVLLPLEAYQQLAPQIKAALRATRTSAADTATTTTTTITKTKTLRTQKSTADYTAFKLDDYVRNPVALARIQAKLTQTALAKRMKVTQPYIAKLESQSQVSAKTLAAVAAALT